MVFCPPEFDMISRDIDDLHSRLSLRLHRFKWKYCKKAFGHSICLCNKPWQWHSGDEILRQCRKMRPKSLARIKWPFLVINDASDPFFLLVLLSFSVQVLLKPDIMRRALTTLYIYAYIYMRIYISSFFRFRPERWEAKTDAKMRSQILHTSTLGHSLVAKSPLHLVPTMSENSKERLLAIQMFTMCPSPEGDIDWLPRSQNDRVQPPHNS